MLSKTQEFPTLHSTTQSTGFSLRLALLHFVGWLPTIRLHASLFTSSRRVWPLKSKEATGHFQAQTLNYDWYTLNTFPYSRANRNLLANKGFHSQILVRLRVLALQSLCWVYINPVTFLAVCLWSSYLAFPSLISLCVEMGKLIVSTGRGLI